MWIPPYLTQPPVRGPEVQDNFRMTMELYQAGEDMKRQQFAREHPEATEAEIEAMVVQWLSSRSDAHPGRPRKLRAPDEPALPR